MHFFPEVPFCKIDEYSVFKKGVVAMSDFFDLPSLNIIWGLINSSRFEYTDQALKAGWSNI